MIMKTFLACALVTLCWTSQTMAAGSAGLIWVGCAIGCDYQTDYEEHLMQDWKDAGASRVDRVLELPSVLSDYALILVAAPLLKDAERRALIAAYQSGTALIVVGENDSWLSQENASLNELLSDMGFGDIQLKNNNKGPWGTYGEPTTDVNSAHPLMMGVNRLLYNALTTIDAPAKDVMVKMPDGPYVAARNRLMVSGDFNLFVTAPSGFPSDVDHKTLFANIWHLLPTLP